MKAYTLKEADNKIPLTILTLPTRMQTLITYFGGKQKLVTTIVPLIPKDTYCYVEPFVGGGAIFFAKTPSPVEIINDIDGQISIFYRILKNNFTALKKRIDTTLYDRTTFSYAKFIRSFPKLYSDLDIAWSFFILTGLGFSGNMNSFGCYSQGTKAKTFENKKARLTDSYSKRLEGVQIENADALKIIRLRDSEKTTFYLDPPYIGTSMAHYRGTYNEQDYQELLELLTTLKAKFILSSFETDILSDYTKKYGWYTKAITQTKASSRNKDGSKKTKVEVITTNFKTQNQEI